MDRSETLPTIVSRRVTRVPPELEPTLDCSSHQTCPVCETKAAEPYLPVRCKDCGSPLYCSKECRRQGCTSHKSDGYCDQMAVTLQKVRSALDKYESDRPVRREWYQSNFRGEFDGRSYEHLLDGRYSEDPFMKPLLDCDADRVFMLACHPSLACAVERGLFGLLLLRRATYLKDPYNLDVCITSVLLKLYREDDAVAFILYWLDWRSRGRDLDDLRDNKMLHWVRGNCWPFPIVADARLLDISDRLYSFPEQDEVGAPVPLEFALTVLVIKMRFITVYISRAWVATLYLRASSGGHQPLTDDIKSHVISFLVAGGRERYLLQRNHANTLMDYIDERDATLLPALVDPHIIRLENQVCFERFLKEYANGKPVVRTIKSTLMRRYFDRKGTSETSKRAASDGVFAENNVRPQKLPRRDEA